MGIIYLITNNINNKMYVGQTARDLVTRWNEHKSRSNPSDGTYLHNAIAKYGEENFSIKVIEEVQDALLSESEQFYIKQYNSLYPNGYNLTIGGEGVTKIDSQKIYDLWDEGASVSQIASNLQVSVDCVKERLKKYINYSVPESLNRWYKNKIIPIKQYDLKGNFIAEYESIADASIKNNIPYEAIRRVVNGLFQTTANFQWCKVGEEDKIKKNLSNRTTKTSVIQMDLDNVPIQIFESYQAAARDLFPNDIHKQKIVANSIGRVCKGDRPTAYGFKWRTNNDEWF